jgi:hypothetical protein
LDALRPGLIGMGLSAVTAIVVTAVAALFARRSGRSWGVPLGLGLGYALGHAAVYGWLPPNRPPFPPFEVFDWLPWLALAAMLLGFFEVLAPTPAWARWENRLLLTAVAVWVLLGPLVGGMWADWGQATPWLAGIGLGIVILWAVVESHAARLGRSLILPLIVLAGGTSAAMLLGHSLKLAELSAVLAASLGACWIVAFGWPALTLARGGVPVFVAVLAGLLLCGHFYSELPAAPAVLLAAAPLTLWIDRIGPLRRLRPWQAALVRVVAVLVPVGAAIAITVMQAPPPVPEGYY